MLIWKCLRRCFSGVQITTVERLPKPCSNVSTTQLPQPKNWRKRVIQRRRKKESRSRKRGLTRNLQHSSNISKTSTNAPDFAQHLSSTSPSLSTKAHQNKHASCQPWKIFHPHYKIWAQSSSSQASCSSSWLFVPLSCAVMTKKRRSRSRMRMSKKINKKKKTDLRNIKIKHNLMIWLEIQTIKVFSGIIFQLRMNKKAHKNYFNLLLIFAKIVIILNLL